MIHLEALPVDITFVLPLSLSVKMGYTFLEDDVDLSGRSKKKKILLRIWCIKPIAHGFAPDRLSSVVKKKKKPPSEATGWDGQTSDYSGNLPKLTGNRPRTCLLS